MTSREVGSGGVIPGVGGVAAATRPAAGRPAPPLVGPCSYKFTADGTFTDGATLSGSLDIDVTTGTATSADLLAQLQMQTHTHRCYSQEVNYPLAGDSAMYFSARGYPFLVFYAFTPTGSLVGYSGGQLNSLDYNPNGYVSCVLPNSSSQVNLTQGSLTAAAVPEPSTAVLAVFGALSVIAYGWSRHRREQPRQAVKPSQPTERP